MDFQSAQHQLPEQKKAKPQPEQALKCPRCESTNTKFCYYNNYSLSQPRYFCKSCRRYWTKGGTLRNVPVGGGCRKKHRQSPSASPSPASKVAIKTLDHPSNVIYGNIKNEASLMSGLSSMGQQRQIELSLAFAMLHKQSLHSAGDHHHHLGFEYGNDHLPIFGNSTSNLCDVLGNPISSGAGGLYGNGFNGSSYRGNVEEQVGVVQGGNPSTTFSRFPWGMNHHGDGGIGGSGIDQIESAGRDGMNGLISTTSSWHGLLNTPLM